MNFAKLYEHVMRLHAVAPYYFGSGKAFPPQRVHVEVTGRCNLKCDLCYQDDNYKHGGEELTHEEVISIIDQAPRYSLFTFSGGEPLLRKDIASLIDHAAGKHFCNIITNGVLLTEEIIRLMIKKRFLLINLSLDAVGDLHDEMRGVKGVFEKVRENVDLLRDLKKAAKKTFPLLDIKTVITEKNLSHLGALYDFCEEVGADFFTPSLVKSVNLQFNGSVLFDELNADCFYRDYPDYPYDVPKLIDAIDRLKKEKKKTRLRVYPRFKKTTELKNYLERKGDALLDHAGRCFEPWSGFQINAYGEAYPCLSYCVGNIRENTLSKIWNSGRFVEFRRRLRARKLYPACAGCCYLNLTRTGRNKKSF